MAGSSPSNTPGVIPSERRPVVDASDRLLVPGLVNGHTHGHGASARARSATTCRWKSSSARAAPPMAVVLSRTSASAHPMSAVELIRKGCTAGYDLFVEYPVRRAKVSSGRRGLRRRGDAGGRCADGGRPHALSGAAWLIDAFRRRRSKSPRFRLRPTTQPWRRARVFVGRRSTGTYSTGDRAHHPSPLFR